MIFQVYFFYPCGFHDWSSGGIMASIAKLSQYFMHFLQKELLDYLFDYDMRQFHFS